MVEKCDLRDYTQVCVKGLCVSVFEGLICKYDVRDCTCMGMSVSKRMSMCILCYLCIIHVCASGCVIASLYV